MEYKDFLGNPIQPNDIVAYAVSSRDKAVLKKGRVIELSTTNHWHRGKTPSLRLDVEGSDRVVPFHTLSNCVVIGKASQ